MDTRIQEFITRKPIAVVGASRTNKDKFGNMAATELKRRSCKVTFVHLQTESINGETAYSNLSALRGQMGGVLVSLAAEKGAEVLRDAAAAETHNMWVQQGGESEELIKLGEDLKLTD